jgi:hypothetical protein
VGGGGGGSIRGVGGHIWKPEGLGGDLHGNMNCYKNINFVNTNNNYNENVLEHNWASCGSHHCSARPSSFISVKSRLSSNSNYSKVN